MKRDLLQAYESLRKSILSSKERTLVAFVDLVGSTAFKEQHGLLEGVLRSEYHNRIVSEVAQKHGLSVVKYLGDGVLLKKQLAEGELAGDIAVNFATESLQHADRESLTGQPRLDSRIGIAVGPVVTRPDGDILGPVVDLAARLEGTAKPNQALALGDLISLSSQETKRCLTPIEFVAIRGIDTAVGVTEIIAAGTNPLGIAYDERWTDYDYTVTIHRISHTRSDRISDNFLEATVDLSYKGIFRSTEFDFLAVEPGPDFSKALGHRSVFSCFYMPRSTLRNRRQAERFFRIEKLRVGSIDLMEEGKPSFPTGALIKRTFRMDTNRAPTFGSKCEFSYRVKTLVSRWASFYAMIVEQNIERPVFAFHVGDPDIELIGFTPFFAPSARYEVDYYPNSEKPTGITLRVLDSIAAGQGVSFFWHTD